MSKSIPLSENSLYQSLSKSFVRPAFQESVATLQGFVVGLVLKGFTSSNREMLQHTINLLNEDEPFSGTMIAHFTSLAIEVERELKNGHCEPYFVLAEDREQGESIASFNTRFLTSLTDFAYGVMLGLSPECPTKQLSAPEKNKLNKLLHEMSEITNTEIEASEPLEQDDIDTVVNYIKECITNYYNYSFKMNQKS